MYMLRFQTPDDRANANMTELKARIALDRRFQPLGEALKYERIRKQMATALVIATTDSVPSVAGFISDQSKVSASSQEVNARDLIPLLERIATKRNAEMIYEKVVAKFSNEEIKYSILYWKVIETEMYSAF